MASNAVVRKIGRYDVVDVLGRGGFGAVYKAHDPVMDRLVAIKEILAGAETDAMKKKFAEEARKLAKLNHQNIVTIYDFGEDRGNPYLVMEYIDGHPLDRLMADAARFKNRAFIQWALQHRQHARQAEADTADDNAGP